MDIGSVAQYMPTLVPMVGTLKIEFLELEPQRVVLRLPDQPEYHNHIGGPHAGAMFTLAESASGAMVLGNFGGLIERATPLAVEGSIRYRRVAMGPLYAEALLHDTPESIVATLESGKRPEFRIEVSLSDEAWRVTGEASFLWTLRLNRQDMDPGPRS